VNRSVDEVLNAVAARAQAAGLSVYLVGGAVRDRLLGKSLHDLDFVMTSPTLPFARRIADELRGGLYVMDSQRDITRVVLFDQDDRLILDFSALRAENLAADLQARDFTINAMAVDVSQPEELIDPCAGLSDLHEKRLRACSPTSLQDDPVRVLRGVRLALSYSVRIESQTQAWMRASVPKLPQISAERIRDELFKILEGPRPATAIEVMDQIGALPFVLPELAGLKGVTQSAPHVHDVWRHTLEVMKRLDALWGVLIGSYHAGSAEGLTLATAVNWLGRFRQPLVQHFTHSLTNDRSIRALLMLAALYHDIAKPETRSVEENGRVRFFEHDALGAEIAARRARELALSGDEVLRLETLVVQHMRIHLLADNDEPPTPRAIYRYFRACGDAGIDLCLFTLADTWATYSHTLVQERWLAELKTCRVLLEARWERTEQAVHPPRLVNGGDVMRLLNIKPGPLVGLALEAIREAQVEGLVTTTDAALDFLRTWQTDRQANVSNEARDE
jgi:putative nucleotidyltransferase with HDIG domain